MKRKTIWLKNPCILEDYLMCRSSTQKWLAKQLGITQEHLSGVINKRLPVGKTTRKMLMDIFDTFSFNELFEIKEDEYKPRKERLSKEELEAIKNKEKEYRSNPRYKEKQKEYNAKWYEENGINVTEKQREKRKEWKNENPEKVKASYILNRALIKRLIKRPLECSNCGRSNTRIVGHHPDYCKPLEVIWLCNSCHRLIHKEIEKLNN